MKNKILNIRKLVDPGKWFYVPRSANTADAAARVMSLRKFAESELWWEGQQEKVIEK